MTIVYNLQLDDVIGSDFKNSPYGVTTPIQNSRQVFFRTYFHLAHKKVKCLGWSTGLKGKKEHSKGYEKQSKIQEI